MPRHAAPCCIAVASTLQPPRRVQPTPGVGVSATAAHERCRSRTDCRGARYRCCRQPPAAIYARCSQQPHFSVYFDARRCRKSCVSRAIEALISRCESAAVSVTPSAPRCLMFLRCHAEPQCRYAMPRCCRRRGATAFRSRVCFSRVFCTPRCFMPRRMPRGFRRMARNECAKPRSLCAASAAFA